ncbi:MAG: galactokinase [Candidatus Aminicenantes bacterium]|nr:galactokinase [Candidatus Aminicenantes bacterium]
MPRKTKSGLLDAERGRAQNVLSAFRSSWGGAPRLFRSPGRVNLIGEHTDYNEGFVLPAAVDKAIYLALEPIPGEAVEILAVDLDEGHSFPLARVEKSGRRWPDYLSGVVLELQRAGAKVGAFRCAFGGDIPIGAGLSSSAAIEAGLAYALNAVFGLGLGPLALVKLAQRAENEFVGVRCGVMDQFINIFGREKSVLKLDCRSLEHAYYPFDRPDLRVVLCDTRVKRELAGSEYNVRRNQCEAGVRALTPFAPGARSLRDISLELLEARRAELDPLVFRRCAYVVRENGRVEAACDDLVRGDFEAFGRRMYASHEGLRDDYEVSCPELDVLVEAASGVKGVFGARMMGAGFGGCTVNLVAAQAVGALEEEAGRAFQDAFGRRPAVTIGQLRPGTQEILYS